MTGKVCSVFTGAIHFVRNVDTHRASKFLQIFDHPQAGAQFLAPALLNMPKDIVASAFKGDFPTASTGNIFRLKSCKW